MTTVLTMGYYYYFDPTYILIIIGMVLSLLASARVKSTYRRFSSVRCTSGITGAEAAQRILRRSGIVGVRVERVSGNLTDHYDARTKTLRLSDGVYDGSSVAALGVAAHECGHAVQDDEEYVPLKLRAALVPVANIGANLSWPLILIGLLISGSGSALLITIGIYLFSAAVLFQLVTLPVEFNASSRALQLLSETGCLHDEETAQAKKVLNAAALTYVAAAAASILQLLRLLLLTRNRRNR